MQAFKQAFPTLTKEAYFDYCDRHEGKYEFHDGMVIAMAGGTTTHTRLGGMAYRLLSDSVEENDCEAFVFEKSVAVEFDENYYYPDVVVVCGEAKYDDRKNLLNPVLIVEVLSRSTALYDRNTKFERYRSIPTVHYYLLVSQNSPHIEVFIRPQNPEVQEWETMIIEGLEAELSLPFFIRPLKLSDLYRRVTFDETS